MNKLIKKLKKGINNSGSSIVLVVVGLGFIGVLVGALLTAAGYALRQKIYNYNSKDNFFYLEQAMDEVYAGIGQETMDALKAAYDETVNEVVYYNTTTKSYEAKDNAEANKEFKNKFMENVYKNPFFQDDTTMKDYLESLISNEKIKLEKMPKIVVYDENGDPYASPMAVGSGTVTKVVVTGVVLSRTADYTRSTTSKASFTQTISTDIEISQPDFDVKFGTSAVDLSNVFDYALIAGDGVEIKENVPAGKTLTVKGNIYAAADYYNKGYNTNNNISGSKFDYIYSKISTGPVTNEQTVNKTVNENLLKYKGDTNESKYSGLYIDGTDVAFLSDTMVIPGTIAVMNTGSLSVYNKNNNGIGNARVWCDEFVLGGDSLTNTDGTYSGAAAMLRADLFIQDDLQLDANGSYFSMNGNYVGYNNSTLTNLRDYIEGVDTDMFSMLKGGKKEEKGHLNSSSIAINGMKSTLDFESVDSLYIAGRSYIEHSKRTTLNKTNNTKVYLFNSEMDDYKTGESVTIKSNQLAYIPTNYEGVVYLVDFNHNGVYDEDDDFFVVSIGKPLSASDLFLDHFPTMSFGNGGVYNDQDGTIGTGSDLHWDIYPFDMTVAPENGKNTGIGAKITDKKISNCVPVVLKTIQTATDSTNNKTKNFIYYDFDRSFGIVNNSHTYSWASTVALRPWNYYSKKGIANADDLRKDFIICYTDALLEGQAATATPTEKDLAAVLTDIAEYDDYTKDDDDYVRYRADDFINIDYNASGAVTASEQLKFRIIAANETFSLDNIISGIDQHAGVKTEASDLTKNLNTRYNYLKFALEELDPKAATDVNKTAAIDAYLAKDGGKGQFAISPINTYFNFDKLINSTIVLNGYVIISSKEDLLTITDTVDGVKDGTVRGIILSSGRVQFGTDVNKFEGMIVAGDKIIFPEDSTTLNVNANPEMCKEIIKELQFSSDDSAEAFLDLFKGYEKIEVIDPSEVTESNKIEYLDYSSVVKYSNWMKNVTEKYGR